MKVLLIGSGGREHALAWKLSQSTRVSEVVATPGNAGMASIARVVPGTAEPDYLLRLAHSEKPDLVVIGPEAPLVAGIADRLEELGMRVFGPGRGAARLEGSKAYAKEFMRRHGIPTASYQTFEEREAALMHLSSRGAPLVVKDSALAAGKGVTVARDLAQAEAAVDHIFSARTEEAHGSPSNLGASATNGSNPARPKVVIEDLLLGQEFSYLVFTDGRSFAAMPIAQDYKQADDGDEGPMTGGMGAIAPIELLDAATRELVERDVVERTLAGLRSEGIDYRGVLYFGLMLTADGPMLLEYNVRLGDPETQVVLPLLETDLVEVMDAVIDSRLGELQLEWRDQAAACVVLSAPGYPGRYRKGVPVRAFEPSDDLLLFHAGTAVADGELVSSGGRVLNVVGLAEEMGEAVRKAYQGVSRVDFPGAKFRRDIGSRLLHPPA